MGILILTAKNSETKSVTPFFYLSDFDMQDN